MRNEAGDADMLAEFHRLLGYFGRVALQVYLTQLLPQPVDLGTVHTLTPAARTRVEKEMRAAL